MATRSNDAADVAPLVSARRLRFARELRGWTQRQLADAISSSGHQISAAAISQFESGQTKPSAPTLGALATATSMPIAYFARRRADGELPGFFRALRSVSVSERKRALALAHLVHDLTVALEREVEFPELDLEPIELTTRSEEEIESHASALRRRWGLGTGPVSNVVRELERHGAIVARLPLIDERVDAFSVRFERPVIMLGSNRRITTRSRFDASHELAHMLLHDEGDAETKQAEQEAHRFAGAFLMPADELDQDFPRPFDWSDLLDLKVKWGVSLSALLMRGRQLGAISEARYVNAMKYMSARGWRKTEPGDDLVGPPEQPRVVRSALEVLEGDGTTLADIAVEAGLPLDDLRVIFDVRNEKRRPRINP